MLLVLLGQAAAQTPPDARFAVALFCNPTCEGEVMDVLETDLSSIRGRSGFPDQVTKPGRIMGQADANFGIPDADFIAVYGVEVDRPELLQKSQQVIIAWFASPTAQAQSTLVTAHAAFAHAAEVGGGWVEDMDTQQVFGAESWKKRDPKGPIDNWFVVDGQPQDPADESGPVRLVTRGLRRFGLPELMVDNVNPALAGDVGIVLNSVAHGLQDRPISDEKLDLKTSTVEGSASFEVVSRLDDDPDDPIWRVSFDGQITIPPEDLQEEPPILSEAPAPEVPAEPVPEMPVAPEAPVVTEFSPPPEAPPVAPEPPPAPPVAAAQPPRNLDDAHQQAIIRLDTVVRNAWQGGLPEGDVVAVSVPFRTRDGGNEFMWVELRTWEGESLSGVLVNQPYNVEGLQKGAPVNIAFQDVFDYIWKHADGTREGNVTSRFVQR